MNDKRSKPREFLENCLGDKVKVELKRGGLVRGELKSFDEHLNLKLGGACKTKNGPTDRKSKSLIIRGSSVVFISPSPV
ncbi:hypothetical protein AKJ41_01360 [candidate division MSBL1 archaeon SCGC-AAA259O05]|uniref:Sm domain-containing protein n=1 Tax=candidate division MSBL1 archaeon SCGC-AAA259O05 TaxID=1698271 RepID=A0A133V4Y8_9EURY|nr:hypothetical protein AKJ41_01360 [candidate division MSBL1 archaeon SCGC-AAA259O05]